MSFKICVRFVTNLTEAAVLLLAVVDLGILVGQVKPLGEVLPFRLLSLVAERRGPGPALDADFRPRFKLGNGRPGVPDRAGELDKGADQLTLFVSRNSAAAARAQVAVLCLELCKPVDRLAEGPDVTAKAPGNL